MEADIHLFDGTRWFRVETVGNTIQLVEIRQVLAALLHLLLKGSLVV